MPNGNFGLNDLPIELLEMVLADLVPDRWNRHRPSCGHPTFLGLRLVCKLFNDIIPRVVLRKLCHKDLIRRSWWFGKPAVEWLLATRLMADRDKQTAFAESIWNTVLLVTTDNFDENQSLRAACHIIVANRGREWACQQLENSSRKKIEPAPVNHQHTDSEGEPESSDPWLTADPAALLGGFSLAAYHGNESIVKILLMNGINPNDSNESFGYALYAAAYSGHEGIVRLLVDGGADLGREGVLGTPLEAAAHRGHIGIVRFLRSRQASLDANYKTNKCLLYASEQGHADVVQLLLSHCDADLNVKNRYGQSPLVVASAKRHWEVVKLLSGWPGLNPNIQQDHEGLDHEGFTALTWAAKHGSFESARLLLSRHDINPDLGAGSPGNPLLAAVTSGHEDIVRLLVTRDDVKLHRIMGDGFCPLWSAIILEHEKVLGLLLHHYRIQPDKYRYEGDTLLWGAMYNRRYRAPVRTSDGSNVSSEKTYDFILREGRCGRESALGSALSMASNRGKDVSVRVLLQHPEIDPNSADCCGRSPLWLAAFTDKALVVGLLLAHRLTRPNQADVYGWTPLLAAANEGHDKIVELLLNHHETDPNIANEDGWAPLHVAANHGNEDMVQCLLRHPRIDRDLALGDGTTSVALSQQRGHSGVVRLLTSGNRDEND